MICPSTTVSEAPAHKNQHDSEQNGDERADEQCDRVSDGLGVVAGARTGRLCQKANGHDDLWQPRDSDEHAENGEQHAGELTLIHRAV